ncbi:MAG: hypothetical protein ABSD70_12915 [Terracidiphilus sp.]|jgi:hypothetical protein
MSDATLQMPPPADEAEILALGGAFTKLTSRKIPRALPLLTRHTQ